MLELKTPQTATVAGEAAGGFCGSGEGKMERFHLLKKGGHVVVETGRVKDHLGALEPLKVPEGRFSLCGFARARRWSPPSRKVLGSSSCLV